eukprot:Clim_evm1s142 gene=Clim_evmTU1s142
MRSKPQVRVVGLRASAMLFMATGFVTGQTIVPGRPQWRDITDRRDSPASLIPDASWECKAKVAAADFTGDQFPDLVITHQKTGGGVDEMYLYTMNANGKWVDSGVLSGSEIRTDITCNFPAPTVGDVDGDGLMDIVVGCAAADPGTREIIFWFKNTGTAIAPVFTRQASVDNPFSVVGNGIADTGISEVVPELVDWDGDGDLDLLVGQDRDSVTPYSMRVYLNTGDSENMALADQSSHELIELDLGSSAFDYAGDASEAVASAVDLNNDGYLDVLFTSTTGRVFYMENGYGTYEHQPTHSPFYRMALDPFTKLTWADIDLDGDLDMIGLGNGEDGSCSVGANLRIWLNLGSAGNHAFGLETDNDVEGTWQPIEPQSNRGHWATSGDLNGDGIPEVIICEGGTNPPRVLWNQGSEEGYALIETDTGSNPVPVQSGILNDVHENVIAGGDQLFLTLCDMNNDGLQDLLVVANDPGVSDKYYCIENSGDAETPTWRWSDAIQFSSGDFYAGDDQKLGCVDYNNDAMKDIVLVDNGGKFIAGSNNGGAYNTWVLDATDPFASVDVSDSVQSEPPQFYIVDIDGDNDLDVIAVQDMNNDGISLRFYESENGVWTDVTYTSPWFQHDFTATYQTLVAIDIDGDGDMDFILGDGTTDMNYSYVHNVAVECQAECFGRGVCTRTLNDANNAISLLGLQAGDPIYGTCVCQTGFTGPDCRLCDAGYQGPIVDGQGAARPMVDFGNVQSTCTACILGRYSSEPGLEDCTPCGTGTYADVIGMDVCFPCPIGKFGNVTEMSECNDCDYGYYTADIGRSVCDACDTHYYTPSRGSNKCLECSAGEVVKEDKSGCEPCAIGTYEVRGVCINCPDGYSCPNAGTSVPDECSAGEIVSEDRSDCVPCAIGTYELRGECVDCPDGHSCPTAGTSEPQECSAGYIVTEDKSGCDPCPAGTYELRDECLVCPDGHSCPTAGTSVPQECSAGDIVNESKDGCDPCPAGMYELRDECKTCPDGHSCPTAGTSAPQECSAGYIVNDDRDGCVACPAGTYELRDECVVCPVGHSCPTTGTSEPQECSAGYVVNDDKDGCDPCPAGTYELRDECKICPDGHSCPTAGTAVPQECSAGDVVNDEKDACVPCAIGTYELRDECIVCPDGHSCPTTGTSVPQECSAGDIVTEDRSACEPCAVGTYELRGECVVCPDGHSCPSPGTSVPQECSAGEIMTDDRSDCEPCSAGTYELHGECVACPDGHSCPTAGTSVPQVCGAGEVSRSDGIGCDGCEIGTYEFNDECVDCPAGKQCPIVLMSSPLPCPSGQISASEGGSECIACPEGTSANAEQTRCESCTPGYIAVNGMCTACSAGTYQPDSGAISCIDCPIGLYSENEASTSCNRCQSGTYAPTPGLSVCLTCPSGFYNIAGGMSECFACPEVAGVSCVEGLAVIDVDYWGYFNEDGSVLAEKCPTGYCLGGVAMVLTQNIDFTSTSSRRREINHDAWVTSMQEHRRRALRQQRDTSVTLTEAMASANVSQCADGREQSHDNFLCGRCMDGYYEWGGNCVECEGTNWGLVALYIIIGAVYVLALYAIAPSPKRKTPCAGAPVVVPNPQLDEDDSYSDDENDYARPSFIAQAVVQQELENDYASPSFITPAVRAGSNGVTQSINHVPAVNLKPLPQLKLPPKGKLPEHEHKYLQPTAKNEMEK